MAEAERSLDKVTIAFDIPIDLFVKLEVAYRPEGVSLSCCMTHALSDLLGGVQLTEAMKNRAREIYEKNVARRIERREKWARKHGNGK